MVLFWVNNHFVDFETDAPLCEFLESFEGLLEREVRNDKWFICHNNQSVSITGD